MKQIKDMNTYTNIVITLSILTIGIIPYSIQAEDYIMNTDDRTYINTYSLYPFNDETDIPTVTKIIFQPSDGSLDNGSYDKLTKIATTKLHTYTNVIALDASMIPSKLTSRATYKDNNGQELIQIGIWRQYLHDSGDNKLWYLFGKLSETTRTSAPQKNSPIQTYYSTNS